jgi:unsaturated chondroitin disaccharide hydrolase
MYMEDGVMCKGSFFFICIALLLAPINDMAFGYESNPPSWEDQNDYSIAIGEPVIDGVISPGEWDDAEWINIGGNVYGGGTWPDCYPNDLTDVMWANLWSPGTNLIYVVVQGTDSSHNFGTYVSWNTQDDLEVYVDAGQSNLYGYNSSFRYGQQYFLGPNGGGGDWVYLDDQPADALMPGGYAVGVDGNVITYEFAITPYEELDLVTPGNSIIKTLQSGDVVGLDICMVTVENTETTFMCEHSQPASMWSNAGNLLDLTLIGVFLTARNGSPTDGRRGVEPDVVLSWEPGDCAVLHDVYLGTNSNDVNDANTSDTTGIYRDTIDVNNWPVDQTLQSGQIYYWRIDEVNDTDPCSPWKGDVWSFTVKTAVVSKGDLTGDGFVGLEDVAVMADGWLEDWPRADIAPITGDGSVSISDGDGIINMADFALLSQNWQSESLLLSSGVLDLCSRRLMETALTQDSSRYPGETDIAYTWWAKYSSPTKVEGWKLGFFPGCLWYMYELTNDLDFLAQAQMWTIQIEDQQYNTVFGDHGFVLLDSFGHWYRLTGMDYFRQVVVQGAQSLASRYSPVVGCVRSWSWGSWESPTKFTVVIDTMMNLRILFWAARNGGSSDLYDKAISHVYKTIKNHVRADGSTYHVVVYYPDTGEVNYKTTLQGYSVDSCWSRGQAWALHGMTVAYRETDDPNILIAAKKVADYFVDNLPADYVPYTDFEAPEIPNLEKDSSAASIAASGLLELCTLVSDPAYQEKYYNAAKNILTSLCTRHPDGGYLAEDNDGNFLSPSILMRGCNRYGWYEVGTIYGDYFFVQALMRYKGLTDF